MVTVPWSDKSRVRWRAVGAWWIGQRGRRAARRHEPHAAFQAWTQLAEYGKDKVPLEHTADAYLRAVQHLERSQSWRMVAGMWDHLGDRLGDELYFGAVKSPQAQELLYRYYLSRELWDDPRPDNANPGYYRGDLRAIRAHQQAWAYAHGAEEAAANRRFALATLLYRKAGLAWASGSWGDRPVNLIDGQWTEDELKKASGGKWEQAARCYFRAALFQIESSLWDEKGQTTFNVYTATEVRWPWSAVTDAESLHESNSDIDRLLICWRNWGVNRAGLAEAPRERCLAEIHAGENGIRQLGSLKDALLRAGRGDDALRVHRKVDEMRRTVDWLEVQVVRRPAAFLTVIGRWLYWLASKSGTDVSRTLLTVGILLFLLIPTIGWLSSAVVSPAGRNGALVAASLPDHLLYALTNAVTLSVPDLQPNGHAGALASGAHSLLAYFAFGFTIWVMLRPFER